MQQARHCGCRVNPQSEIRNLQSATPADKGIENHIPFVNRLVGWWRRMQDARFLATATREQRAALKRDLEPVVQIYNQL